MASTELHYGSFIPEEVVTAWVQVINDYELNYRPELVREIFCLTDRLDHRLILMRSHTSKRHLVEQV